MHCYSNYLIQGGAYRKHFLYGGGGFAAAVWGCVFHWLWMPVPDWIVEVKKRKKRVQKWQGNEREENVKPLSAFSLGRLERVVLALIHRGHLGVWHSHLVKRQQWREERPNRYFTTPIYAHRDSLHSSRFSTFLFLHLFFLLARLCRVGPQNVYIYFKKRKFSKEFTRGENFYLMK